MFYYEIESYEYQRSSTDDFDEIWPIFHDIVSAGEIYAYPQETKKEQAIKFGYKAMHSIILKKDMLMHW